MNIEIANHVITKTPRLCEYIEQRLGVALGPNADRIGIVAVKFVVVKLAGGAKVIRCRINVGLRKTVSAEAADADVFAAVDRAVETATRRLVLAIELENAAGPASKPSKKR